MILPTSKLKLSCTYIQKRQELVLGSRMRVLCHCTLGMAPEGFRREAAEDSVVTLEAQ